jgi:hypothetical protein
MSTATYPTTSGDFGHDGLAAFLAQVPAAGDYDRDEIDRLPRHPKHLGRKTAKARAIAESERGFWAMTDERREDSTEMDDLGGPYWVPSSKVRLPDDITKLRKRSRRRTQDAVSTDDRREV